MPEACETKSLLYDWKHLLKPFGLGVAVKTGEEKGLTYLIIEFNTVVLSSTNTFVINSFTE